MISTCRQGVSPVFSRSAHEICLQTGRSTQCIVGERVCIVRWRAACPLDAYQISSIRLYRRPDISMARMAMKLPRPCAPAACQGSSLSQAPRP